MLRKGIPIFFTATNLYWKPLLENNSFKDIVIRSLQFLVKNGELIVFGFVIMPNHMHLLIKIPEIVSYKRDVQHALLSFTAHEFKNKLRKDNPLILEDYFVNDSDRDYQFWERNALGIDIFSIEVAEEKLKYIHDNPLQEKWKLAANPEDYYYSSANFYKTGIDIFCILTDYRDYFKK